MPYAPSPPPAQLEALLSIPRFAAYRVARGGNLVRAAELYGWNARVSAALLLPMHFAEIAARNVVDDALTQVYGSDWPWQSAFRRTLPIPSQGYRPKTDLADTAGPRQTRPPGKVIAELKFVFWPTMFTARHDTRVWNVHLATLLPNAAAVAGTTSVKRLRSRVHRDLDSIRHLRNLVAHHEPIHTEPLADHLKCMLELIDMRCTTTGQWVRQMERRVRPPSHHAVTLSLTRAEPECGPRDQRRRRGIRCGRACQAGTFTADR